MDATGTASTINTMSTDEFMQQVSIKETVEIIVSGSMLVIDESKLELCLTRCQSAFQPRVAWTTPAGILVAVALSLSTADFRPFLGIPAATWHALFIMAFMLSLGWTVWSVYLAMRTERASAETVMRELRRETRHLAR